MSRDKIVSTEAIAQKVTNDNILKESQEIKIKSKETQLLTDSTMMEIDTFCSSCVLGEKLTSVRKLSSPQLSMTMPNKIEFVSSLLNPDMKVR